MDIVNLYDEAKSLRPDVTIEKIASIIASIDRLYLEQAERSRYSYAVWDHVSPVNGVSAEQVISSRGISADDVVYMIYRDGVLLYFQDAAPDGRRLKSVAEAEAAAEAQISDLVKRAVDEHVRQQVLRRVLGLLRVTSNKQVVYANGQDTATITASSIDLKDGDQVTFDVPGAGSITVTASGGKAVVPFTTTVPGDWPVTASHPTLGSATVLIRGV